MQRDNGSKAPNLDQIYSSHKEILQELDKVFGVSLTPKVKTLLGELIQSPPRTAISPSDQDHEYVVLSHLWCHLTILLAAKQIKRVNIFTQVLKKQIDSLIYMVKWSSQKENPPLRMSKRKTLH